MGITAPRLHAAARRRLDGPLRDLGFSRVPNATTAAWVRSQDGHWLFVWFQPSPHNGPRAPGFRFTVELRLTSRAVLYAAGRPARLPTLFADAEREHLRSIENRVIASLERPDAAYLDALPEPLRSTVLADWEPRLDPYAPGDHVWFRAAGDGDVDELLELIARELPGAIDRFLATGVGPR